MSSLDSSAAADRPAADHPATGDGRASLGSTVSDSSGLALRDRLPALSSCRTVVVIPCYNEAARLDRDAFLAFIHDDAGPSLTESRVGLLFVDDGSTDDTWSEIVEIARRAHERSPRRDFSVVSGISLSENTGKAGAVRAGMLDAFSTPKVEFAGYWDADLSTRLDEVEGFVAELMAVRDRLAVMGSRVNLLGRGVERKWYRHYVGRIFATCASLALGVEVYDTQCGAKMFRNTAVVRSLFEEPFTTGWTFDCEIIARHLVQLDGDRDVLAKEFVERPLRRWRDVAGSKVRPSDLVGALAELVRIRERYSLARLGRGAD